MTMSNSATEPPASVLDRLIGLLNRGHFAEVVTEAQVQVRTYSGSFALWSILGAGSAQSGEVDLAVTAFAQACAISPGLAEAHSNLGNALKNQARFDEAVASYRQALTLRPDLAGVHYNLGGVLQDQGRLDEAAACYGRAIALDPGFADAHHNLGLVLAAQGRLDEAAQSFARVLQRNPRHVAAYNSFGNIFKDMGRLDDAIVCYQQALAVRPDYAEAHNNLGIVRSEQGLLDAACASLSRALALKPDYAEAHYNLGDVLTRQGKLDAAVESYRSALALRPGYADAEAQLRHQQQHMCDWHDHDAFAAAFARLASDQVAPPPFTCLAMTDDAAAQLEISRHCVAAKYREAPLAPSATPRTRSGRLRIGYFSADFHDHATLFLMAGLLREHDTTRFEVFAYSYGRHAAGEWGQRARESVEHFFDVAGQPSRAIVDLARSHALDIAIDLKGHTAHCRLDLFQLGLAPVQISYLGYPGSLGADFIDYIVADPVVIPDHARAYYSESVIRLPHSYQPNDNQRPIAETVTTRADFGLPEHGVVLCCFNGSYKISPREFDIWMRVMREIDGSVLWLFRSNRWCEANLRKEAAARGIAPERLVFAERADHAQHLARHKHADLFLDTFNVNAHTTASDALWAGLPVVTRVGQQFAARVSASLLTAVGLPELITHNDADYEALILELAADPVRLAGIRAKLAANRLTHPLFDTQQYTRDFEAGLQRAYDLWFTGQSPQDIRIG